MPKLHPNPKPKLTLLSFQAYVFQSSSCQSCPELCKLSRKATVYKQNDTHEL